MQKPALAVLALAALAVSGVAFAEEKKTLEKKEQTSGKKELFVKKAQDEGAEYYQLGILLEYFRLEHRTANRLIRAHAPKAADAKELRDELERLIDEESAELLESAWLPARGGERAKNESVREVIYPTEYDPPEIPNTYGASSAANAKKPEQQLESVQRAAEMGPQTDLRVPMTHGTPTAFETRNVGVTTEVDSVLGADLKIANISLAPEMITHLGYEYFTRDGREDTAYGIDHQRMPLFHAMKITTSVTVVIGNENLLAIHTPPDDPDHRVLVMMRVDLIPVQ